MLLIKFKYRDKYTKGNWSSQQCQTDSIEHCKQFYGLGIDTNCDYEIVSVQQINSDGSLTDIPVTKTGRLK